MTGPFFVDSNILPYRRNARHADKQAGVAEWIAALWETGSGRLSVQVLQEFYHVATRKLRPSLPPEAAQAEAREFYAWRPVAMTPALLDAAWTIERAHRLSFWDSLIVAAARAAACSHLLTEDLQDGQEIDGLLVVDPFRHRPVELGLPTAEPTREARGKSMERPTPGAGRRRLAAARRQFRRFAAAIE